MLLRLAVARAGCEPRLMTTRTPAARLQGALSQTGPHFALSLGPSVGCTDWLPIRLWIRSMLWKPTGCANCSNRPRSRHSLRGSSRAATYCRQALTSFAMWHQCRRVCEGLQTLRAKRGGCGRAGPIASAPGCSPARCPLRCRGNAPHRSYRWICSTKTE
jgi:hypothetical protein